MATMMLGEVSPGGVGSGLYGLLMAVVLAVFIAGLMVGRTPEYLGKQVGRREITWTSLYLLALPLTLLVSAALAIGTASGRAGIGNAGPHGLSEVVYAMASTANSNGSAFGGLTATSGFYLDTLSVVFVVALAGAFARQRARPAGRGTLATDTPLFVVLTGAVVVLVTLLSFLPALALGPLAEAL
jgi:K+-transporting ATPase ATPase A chain